MSNRLSNKRCNVPGCTSSTNLFRFPKNDIIGLQWVIAVNNPLLMNLPYGHILSKQYGICSLHFLETQIHKLNKRTLVSKEAIPTINLPTTSGNDVILPHTSASPSINDALCLNEPLVEGLNPGSTSTLLGTSTSDLVINNQAELSTTNVACSSGIKEATSTKRKAEDSLEREKIKKSRNYYCKKTKELREELKRRTDSKYHDDIENFTEPQQTFIGMLFRNVGVDKHARRYTNQEKLLCLSIYKKSPSTYAYLKNILMLPSESTLKCILYKIPMDCGVTETVKAYLSTLAKKTKEKNKVCVLMWDEMSISPHLQFCKRRDKVIGFHDFGGHRAMKFATQALVFMIRGIHSNWKLPICYYFSHSSTDNIQLSECITQVVTAIQEAGFNIIASVCDQSMPNTKAISNLCDKSEGSQKQMQIDEGLSYIINDKEIVHLFDIPHIIKCVRNNFITKKLVVETANERLEGSWDHIKNTYDKYNSIDRTMLEFQFDSLCKLTKHHIKPGNESMKVKLAMEVFSKSFSDFIFILSSLGVVPAEYRSTALILKFFNRIIDFTNGSPNDKSPERCAWTSDSYHNTRYEELLNRLDTIKFNGPSQTPCLYNLKLTLKGFKFLFNSLQNLGISKMYTRYFNQDPLENFFGQIRAHGFRATRPTAYYFESLFKTLLITNMNSKHNPAFNCEDDFGHYLEMSGLLDLNDDDVEMQHNIQDIECDDGLSSGESSEQDNFVDIAIEFFRGEMIETLQSNIVSKVRPYMYCQRCDLRTTSNLWQEKLPSFLHIFKSYAMVRTHNYNFCKKTHNTCHSLVSNYFCEDHAEHLFHIFFKETCNYVLFQLMSTVNKIIKRKINVPDHCNVTLFILADKISERYLKYRK